MESILVSLLIGILVAGVAYYAVSLLPLPHPFPQIAKIIILVIFVIWLIKILSAFL